MEIRENGQGFLRSNLSGVASYRSFVPAPLQTVAPSLELSKQTIRTLSECSRRIGELEGMLRFVPNSDMYLTMYVRKEALLSSQIEGTQCTFDDVLDPNAGELLHKDVSDVINYVCATDYAVKRMEELPLCTRLLKEIHSILLTKGRGVDKLPGEVRSSQNWIGPQGCTLKEAPYVPPNIEDMNTALTDLERFINQEEQDIDPIVKAALVHYQFETIHPFLDGNGRLGRLLITLSLMNDRVLSQASFYPSYRLKLKRWEYYERLMSARTDGDYPNWIGFFCECLLEAANDAIASLRSLVELHDRNMSFITKTMGRAATNGQRLLEMLEGNPITDASFIAEKLEISRATASNLIRSFEDLGILSQVNEEKKRYRTFLYSDYLAILREGGEPL